MQLTVHTFITHKLGDTESDCQDSVFPEPGQRSERIFAVADGATNSFFSRLWAQQLTRQFAEEPDKAFRKDSWNEWLSKAQVQWRGEVEKIAKAPGASFVTLNGFHGRKPAVATLVGLRLNEENEKGIAWDAAVLGDSCLFHLREKTHDAYPELKGAEFTYIVDGLNSIPDGNASEPKISSATAGGDGTNGPAPIVEGDVMLLATDALSQWMVKRDQMGEPVWGHVLRLETPAEFEKLVTDARKEAKEPMVNDDVSLVVLRFGKTHKVYAVQEYKPQLAPPPSPPMAGGPQPYLSREIKPAGSLLDVKAAGESVGASSSEQQGQSGPSASGAAAQRPNKRASVFQNAGLLSFLLVVSLLCSFFTLAKWITAIGEIGGLEKAGKKKTAEIAAQEEKIKELDAEIGKLKKRSESLDAQFATVSSGRGAEVDVLKGELASAKSAQAKAESDFKNASTQLEAARKQLKELGAQVKGAAGEAAKNGADKHPEKVDGKDREGDAGKGGEQAKNGEKKNKQEPAAPEPPKKGSGVPPNPTPEPQPPNPAGNESPKSGPGSGNDSPGVF